jgi:flagellar basal body-associated protein FliL
MAKTYLAPHQPAVKAGRIVLLLGIAAVPALGTGLAVSTLLQRPGPAASQRGGDPASRPAYLSFGEVVAPLHPDRGQEAHRVVVKLLLVVDAAAAGSMEEEIRKKKQPLTDWLMRHLSEKSLQEVTQSAGVRKLRLEALQEFNRELVSEGSAKIREVYLEELTVQ